MRRGSEIITMLKLRVKCASADYPALFTLLLPAVITRIALGTKTEQIAKAYARQAPTK